MNEPLTVFFRRAGLVLFVLILPRRDLPSRVIGLGIVALMLLALLAKQSAVVFPIELFLFFLYFRVLLPAGQLRPVDVVVLILVLLVVLGWLILDAIARRGHREWSRRRQTDAGCADRLALSYSLGVQ